MKYSIAFIALLLGSYIQQVDAQTLSSTIKGRSLEFYLNVGGRYNLNQADLAAGNTHLQAKNTISSTAGIEFVATGRSGMAFSTGLTFKLTPQNLFVDYNTTEFGYTTPSKTIRKDIHYTVYSVEWKANLGYCLPVTKSSGVFMATGLILDVLVQGKKLIDGKGGYDNVSSGTYTDLVMYEQIGWGTKDKKGYQSSDIGFAALFHAQAAYKINDLNFLGKRAIKAGVDFTSAFGGNRINRAEVTYYGPNRTKLNTDYFIDKYLAIGLFVGVQI